MNSKTALQLFLLAAIWGGSFPFMRAAAGPFGPLTLIFLRLLAAAICLAPFLFGRRTAPRPAPPWKSLTLSAAIMCVVPFTLLAYASLSLTAGFTSLLNAVTPLMTAIIGRVVWKQRLAALQWLGILIGISGVGFLCWGNVSFKPGGSGWAVAAALLATLCYGIGGHFSKRRLAHLDPNVTTAGTMLAGSVLLLGPGIAWWPPVMPGPSAWLAVLLLGAGCTAVAYLLYYRLLACAGPTQVASVTFLVPAFSLVWSALFLGERLSARMGLAFVIILTGTALTNRLIRPAWFRPARGRDPARPSLPQDGLR